LGGAQGEACPRDGERHPGIRLAVVVLFDVRMVGFVRHGSPVPHGTVFDHDVPYPCGSVHDLENEIDADGGLLSIEPDPLKTLGMCRVQ
jgi:hypothetical protein